MERDKSGKEVTITGYVTAFDLDEMDNVLAIGIVTDEDDYVVEPNEMMQKLMALLDVEVEATGIVKTDGHGTKRITVRSVKEI